MELTVDACEQHGGAAQLLPAPGERVEEEDEEQERRHDVDNVMNLQSKSS